MRSKRFFGIGIVMAVAMLAGSAMAGELKVGKKAKVFSGSEGETVTVVPLEPASSNDFLIKFEGVEGEWDDQVLLHHRTGKGDREDYKLAGGTYASMTVRNGSHQIYPKGTSKHPYVSYSKDGSAKAQPAAILAEYLEQEKTRSKEDEK